MDLLIQIVGWIGALFVVLAYILVSFKKIGSASASYQLMNFFGAVGVGINAFHQAAWPSFVIQIVWGATAIVTLARSKT